MAYDYTQGGNTAIGVESLSRVNVVRKVLNVKDIIASNATLTANGKITAGDDIQAIPVPAHTIVEWVAIKVIEAGTAGNTVEVGLAGGAEGLAATSIATAGASAVTAHGDTWGSDTGLKIFAAVDTIDVEYQEDETTGEIILFAKMIHLK